MPPISCHRDVADAPRYGARIEGKQAHSVVCEVQRGTPTATCSIGARPATRASPPSSPGRTLDSPRSSPGPTRSSVSARSVALGAPEALWRSRDRARVRSGCLRRRHRRNVDQRRDDHRSRPSRLRRSCNRARHRLRDRRRPRADAPLERHPNRMRAFRTRRSRIIRCAGRQLRHSRRIMRSDDRFDAEVSQLATNTRHKRAARRHRAARDASNRKSGSSM